MTWQNIILKKVGNVFIIGTEKLEGNCEFSGNNNVWTRFYKFFVGHFVYCWVISIITG